MRWCRRRGSSEGPTARSRESGRNPASAPLDESQAADSAASWGASWMAAKRSTTSRGKRARDGANRAANQGAEPADLRALARDAALAALKRLADLSRSEDERVALAATQELLNRAFGKATSIGA